MGIKKLTPTSPARRYQTFLTRDELTPGAVPEKSLLEPKVRISGRNNDGRITVRRRGGGHKRFYRVIDFKRNKDGVPGRVTQIEYDPNRSSNIALITYLDGEKRYIVAPVGLEVGRMIASGEDADILPGNTLPIPFAQLLAKEGDYAQLRMPSGEVRRVPVECRATVGQVGNVEHENISLGKAGRTRWRGIRPHVRGVAMNPVDHPHGGGEGKTSGGRNPVTPWGQPTRGYKTRRNKRTKKMIVRDRRVK